MSSSFPPAILVVDIDGTMLAKKTEDSYSTENFHNANIGFGAFVSVAKECGIISRFGYATSQLRGELDALWPTSAFGQPGVGNLPVADFFLTATGTRLFHREGNDLVVDKDNEKEMDVWGFPHDLIRDEIATFGDHYKINISGYDPQAKYGHAYKINMNNAEDRQIQFLLYEILPRMKAHLNDSLKRKNSSQRLSVLSFHANTSEILFGVVPDVRSNKIRLLKQRIKEKNPKFVDDDNTPLVFCGNRRNDFPVLIEEVDVPFGFVRSSSGYERAQAIALKKKFRADPASAPVILSHNPYSLGVIEVLLAVLPQEQQIHAVNCLRETRRRLPEFADLADTSILPREFRRLSDDIGFNNLTIEAMRNYFSSNSSR